MYQLIFFPVNFYLFEKSIIHETCLEDIQKVLQSLVCYYINVRMRDENLTNVGEGYILCQSVQLYLSSQLHITE